MVDSDLRKLLEQPMKEQNQFDRLPAAGRPVSEGNIRNFLCYLPCYLHRPSANIFQSYRFRRLVLWIDPTKACQDQDTRLRMPNKRHIFKEGQAGNNRKQRRGSLVFSELPSLPCDLKKMGNDMRKPPASLFFFRVLMDIRWKRKCKGLNVPLRNNPLFL
jgi:hypothetical protein